MIWDNCEHLLSACRDLARTLLQRCARLRLLVTSREPLKITGETVYRVSGLSLPPAQSQTSLDILSECESVRLFVERAAMRIPEFRLSAANSAAIADVCRRLDGIPLAIELAAARVTVLSVEQIAERLQDRFGLLTRGADSDIPHQQTLRTTMDWSYALLSEAEAALMRRVAVFSGGFTLAAAEAIQGDTDDRYAVLDLLQSLVEKSLVGMQDEGGSVRFAMLETVREYGVGKLAPAEDEAVRRLHADYFLAMAEAAEPALHGSGAVADQSAWLDRLEAEQANTWLALDWTVRQHDGEIAVRLSGALWRFWEIRGYQGEGRHALQGALAIGGQVPAAVRAKALNGAGRLAWRQGDFTIARQLFQQSLDLWLEVGDPVGEADALHGLSRAAVNLADYTQAQALGERSLAIQEREHNRPGQAAALNTLGECERAQSRFARAQALYHEALALYRELGDRAACDTVLYNLGIAMLREGDSDRADALLKESLADADDIRDQCSIYSCLDGLAGVAVARGSIERAVILLGAAETVGKLGGYVGDRIDQEEVDDFTAAARAALHEQQFEAAWSRGARMTIAEAIGFALDSAAAGSAGRPR